MRLFALSILVVFVAAGLTLSTPIGGVSGSISATATVTQPLGIVVLPAESSTSPTEAIRLGILSPRTDGILIEIDGRLMINARALTASPLAEIFLQEIDNTSQRTISLIYTAN